MSRPVPDAEVVARLIRQQVELGAGPIVLEDRSRMEFLRAARGDTEDDPDREAPEAGVDADTRGGPSASVGDDLPTEHEPLETLVLDCTRCPLSEKRTQVVFSDGNPDARVMVVGEAPGANEDRTGLPFVGAAGKLLDLLLASVDLSRETSVYICNVIKCRPPGNRNPRPEEIEACAPYLRRQIQIVQPEVILAVGAFSAQLLTESSLPLGKLRGRIHSYQQIPLVVTYHPAALMRNSSWTRPTWDDFQLLRQLLDSEAGVMSA